MMWLTWRQHRLSFLAGLAAVLAFAAFLIISGFGQRYEFERLGLDRCAAPISTSCPEAVHQFDLLTSGSRNLLPLLLILPALVGVFWGAPLVSREIERGTHRMVWTQSITRRRWLTVEVGVLAAAVVVVVGLSTWLVAWWTDPLRATRPQPFDDGMFDLVGIVPVAYGVAALSIGVAAGTFSRKLVPAIGITLVAFLALRIGVDLGLRPNYVAPVRVDAALVTSDRGFQVVDMPDDIGWTISSQTLDAAGRVISEGVGFEKEALMRACPELERGPESGESTAQPVQAGAPGKLMADCVQRMGPHVVAVYQPLDRYWRFQLTEAGIYLALSAALIGSSAWWLRHRIS